MNIIELFSGSSIFSNEMRSRGHNVIDIDLDPKTCAIKHLNIANLTWNDLCNMFSDKRVDFIFAAPSLICYLGKPSVEEKLWKNILNMANCPFVVEQVSSIFKRDYREKVNSYNINYSIFSPSANITLNLLCNRPNFIPFLKERLSDIKPNKNYIYNQIQTPKQLVTIIADYAEKLFNNKIAYNK